MSDRPSQAPTQPPPPPDPIEALAVRLPPMRAFEPIAAYVLRCAPVLREITRDLDD